MDEIETEVDRLIEILQARPGKAVRMGELANLTHLSIAQVRKWIHILEDRKQVKITYSLSDEEVMWKGIPALRLDKQAHPEDQQGLSSGSSDTSSTNFETGGDSNMEAAQYNEQRFRQNPKWKTNRTKHEETSSYIPKDRQGIDTTSVDESTQMEQNEEPSPHVMPTPPVARAPMLEQVPEPALPPLPKMNEHSMRVSNKLKAKIAAARAKMEEIEKIKGEKKQLLIEVYRPMETKLEAETGAITEKLIELENQLLGIREQAAMVPSEVAELAGEQERIVQISAELRRVYTETDRQMTQSVQALSKARQMAHGRVQDANSVILQQQDALTQMEQHMQDLDSAREQAQSKIEQAQEALSAQESQLATLQENMRAIIEFQQQAQQQTHLGQDEIARQRASLADIDRQLSRMDEVQTWVEAHQSEYNQRMGRLNEYIQTAGTEYNKLKAAIDSGFIHRYLRDLRALSESYEFELSQAQQLETNIDQRIDEAKKELTTLISQAREVADAQEMSMAQSAPKPIDAIEYDEGHARAVQDVRDHQTERVQLREQIRRTLNDEIDSPELQEEEVESEPVEMPKTAPIKPKSAPTPKRVPAPKHSKPVKSANKKR